MAKKIQFNGKINPSLQINDFAWGAPLDTTTGITVKQELIGHVTQILPSEITVDNTNNPGTIVNVADFLMFSKPIEVNKSSVQGYYADVTLQNASNKYAELFAISSEVSPSSK